MITLKDFFEVINYRINEGSDYFFSNSQQIVNCYSISHYDHNYSIGVVFDTKNQTVYIAEVCDYLKNRAYRLLNPDIKFNTLDKQAWDDVNFIDLEIEEDWLEKAQAIMNGEEYDTRVQVPLNFSDEELLRYMKLAHEKDITFNKLIEDALRSEIERRTHDCPI